METERSCKYCGILQPITAYPLKKSTTGKLSYHARQCRTCENKKRRLAYHNKPRPWAYKGTDTQRPCKVCKKMLPIHKFKARNSHLRGVYRRYHDRTCIGCREQQRKPRTRVTQRQNDRGEWYCAGCKKYLHVSNFRICPSRNKRPFGYCRPCYRLYQQKHYRKMSARADWYEYTRLESNRRARERRERRRIERDETARDAFNWLIAHGWKAKWIMKECHICHGTITKLRNGEPMRSSKILERLMALWKREMELEKDKQYGYISYLQRQYT